MPGAATVPRHESLDPVHQGRPCHEHEIARRSQQRRHHQQSETQEHPGNQRLPEQPVIPRIAQRAERVGAAAVEATKGAGTDMIDFVIRCPSTPWNC